MKELTERKKLEILKLFLEGYSYDDISAKSDVAKGSVVNVVTDFKNGRFPTFTDVTDMVDVLRELSVELRKKGAGVSEALLGTAFFFRLNEIGVTPDKLWLWADMCRGMSPPDAPLQEFTAATLEVFKLTQETGESYDSVAAKWSKLRDESESLGQEVENLRSEKKELETTQAVLTEKCHKLKEENDGLDRDIKELSTRCETLRKETSQLEASRQLLNEEVAELDDNIKALRPEMEALEGLGFGKSELQTLRVKLEEIASSQSLTPKVLTTKFFQDLVEYETVVSFQKRREELEGEVATLQAQKESLQHVMSRLGLSPEEVEEAVKSLVSLKKKGVAPSIVASYCRVLSKSSLEPGELEREVIELGGLKKAIDTATQAVKQLQAEAAQRTRVVDALRAEEASIKATIKELTQWGQKMIKEAQGKALTTVKQATEKMAKDLRQWGDKRAELGVYLDDLKRARYFTRLPLSNEALDSYIEDISPLVVSQGLQIVLFWCVRKFNPKLRPPKWIMRKYYSIGEYTDVELADLVRWSLEGLTEGIRGNEGRA
jgi:prefoldin subunit 5